MEIIIFFFVLFIFSILPESPRWLVAKQRYEEAEELLKKIATKNKTIFNKATYDQFVREDKKVMTHAKQIWVKCVFF